MTGTVPPVSPVQRQDRLEEEVERIELHGPDTAGMALLQIARDCGDEPQCRAERINALLETLPRATIAHLQELVAPIGEASAPAAMAPWPGGADATPLLGDSPLLALAEALAMIYTPEAAAFQDDMETIVASTSRDTAAGASPGQRWIEANSRRQQAIAGLLQRDAGHVEWLPYAARGLGPMGMEDPSPAFNLRIRVPPAPGTAAARRLLLVAHGDMIGLSRGSHGAYDNASGVATLLHVARQLAAEAPLAGTQMDLLVTSNEELGLLGANAYIAQCRERDDCPTMVINVDLVGRGGHSYVLSGSDALAASPYLGRAPMFLQAPTTSDTERGETLAFERHFAANGFTRAVPGTALLMTSDNVAFQNASIPCIGIAQVSAVDAEAWVRLDTARMDWLACDAQVDWSRHEALRNGQLQLPADEVAELERRYHAADQAWQRLQALRADHPLAPPVLVHGANDRLHRVSAPMGVAFADALLDVVRHHRRDTPTRPPAATDTSHA